MGIEELEKIERDIISTKHNLVEGRSSLSTVLTQTRLFAKKLNVEHQWITNELEGYHFKNRGEEMDNLPEYRIVSFDYLDMFNRPLILNVPSNDEFKKDLTRFPLTTAITNFQGIDEGGSILIRTGPQIDILRIFSDRGYIKPKLDSYALAGISVHINNNQLLAIYDKVKNLTIEFLSELEDEVKKAKLA